MTENRVLSNKRIIKVFLSIIGVFVGVFIVYKLSYYLAPFIIAYLLAMMMEPLISFLVRHAKIKRKYSALISLLFLLLTVGTIVVLIVLKMIAEIKSFSNVLPKYFSDFYSNISALISRGNEFSEWLPEDIFIVMQNIISDVLSSLSSLTNYLFKGVLSTAISIPEAFIFTLVTIISTFFIAKDRGKIYLFFKKQLPESWLCKITSLKRDMFSAMFGYIKAQLIIMSITFTELLIGLSIIRVRYALLLAFLISIVDALPVLGTGGILVPWAIYELFVGNLRVGISLFVLYIIILVVRQIMEPKVLASQIGVYPLLTLISMYSGMKLIGFTGLILGPITFLLLNNIFSGMLKGKTFGEALLEKKPNN